MVVQTSTIDILEEFVETRSPELRERLVLQSVPLVHYLLGRMGITQEMGSEYEDLAHQGLMGLIEAVDHFDRAFNTAFSTYASLRIRSRILDYLRNADWMPRGARKRVRQIEKAIAALWLEKKREPSEAEIASHLGITVEDVRQGLTDSHRTLVSLDLMIETERTSGMVLYEDIRDENEVDPSEGPEEWGLLQELAGAITKLSEREQLILSLYYNEELTFREIGKVLDVTESRVSQLHSRAILNLKAMMQDEQ